ncbi:DUF4050 domain-containing protein [Cephalotus follicularis]|uniref:DUF4050 domain-containing protein n=1 Tax=Cephalotus follicularis TaxID=3775 RepID=A0A1Q3AYV9_CEPFO|nr:DUF4050 domain-containing protein [Cephalotus follicularis]
MKSSLLTSIMAANISFPKLWSLVRSSCSRSLQAAISFDRTLKEQIKRNTCQQLPCQCGKEWSSNSESMEIDTGSHSNEQRPLECSTSANEGKEPTEKDKNTSLFVNHAAISWHENRRSWVGDVSQRPQRMAKDPIISWSTTYEELLSTNEPFSEPIPLPEMVDFLVDIWHDEGLFD